jgi:hypothetical protein
MSTRIHCSSGIVVGSLSTLLDVRTIQLRFVGKPAAMDTSVAASTNSFVTKAFADEEFHSKNTLRHRNVNSVDSPVQADWLSHLSQGTSAVIIKT